MSEADQPLQPADSVPGASLDGSARAREPAAPRAAASGSPRDPGSEAHELTEADFLAAQAPPPDLRPPGPGLPEAIGWTVGTILVHVLAVVIVLSGVFLWHAAQGRPVPWPDGLALEKVMAAVDAVILFGGEQLIFVIVAASLAAVRLRMSDNHYALEERRARARGGAGRLTRGPGRLSLDRIAPGHIMLILCLVLPVALLATKGQQAFAEFWNRLAESVPGMEPVDSARMVKQLLEWLQDASLPTLVLVLAVLPAIGEEIVFRGVVGRGLTARWGLVAGVLLTSLLFAVVHLDPVHAVGVFPLGITIHLVYLATRSFWAPVLYHFLNNAMAATGIWAARLAEDPAVAVAADAPEMPPLVYVAAALCVVSILLLMWRTRVEYLLDDGTLWTPGYDTAEAPPERLASVRLCRRAEAGYYAFVALGVLAFGAALVYAVWPAVK
jgi:uncharacterized protein